VSRTLAIAVNTFRETIRDRILGVIVIFALLMIVASLWLASISLGQQGRMMKDFGLVAVSFFGLIVAVFVGASLLHKEVEKRTVFVIFSKPVGRAQFIFAKFLGLASTLACVLAGMGLFLFFADWAVSKTPSTMVLAATALIYLELLVIVAITILLSTVTSTILASVLGITVFVAGQLSRQALSLTSLGHDAVLKALSWVVYVVIPNLNAVDVKPAAVGEANPQWLLVAAWGGYLVAYAVLALLFASWVFGRKEF
jgi:ABC-type transport system involved in multi-copper enzyme maturation permease subunit